VRLRLKPVRPETLALAGLWTTLQDAAAALALLAAAAAAWAPREDLPWTPLRLADPVGLATGFKFARVAADPARCRAVLREGGLRFADQPDRTVGGCALHDVVRLEGGKAMLSPAGPPMTCPLALGYAFWLRHVVQPAARAELGAPILRVEHYGSFACRNVYGRADGRRSEHAFANAIDVAGFRTAAGREVAVRRDFRDSGAAGRFLRRVRDGACPWFHAVLSPDYNAAHRDHLHLDFGRYRLCR
jgi:hypothetical protein